MSADTSLVIWFENLRRSDVPRVGGKNASLGEMIANLSAGGISVPPGFATTANAFWRFVEKNALKELTTTTLADHDAGKIPLADAGRTIRSAFLRGEWPPEIAEAIGSAYRELSARRKRKDVDVAVRSSATAEDLPDASFAGQQETFLNIRGETAVLDACRRCYASLFTDRAITYRKVKGFDHLKVALSVGVQAMVRSDVLHDQQEVTVSCAEGDEGFVYEGTADFETEELDMRAIPRKRTKVMLNLAHPAAAFRWWRLPADGVGLARMEFVVSNHIKIHPMALVRFDALKDEDAKRKIIELTQTYADKPEYFVDRLARGLARIAAAHVPSPVIIRMSDFKTNEYANLIGGREFEPKEENPMIGFRGASRYYSPLYREGFALECKAIKRLRDQMGFRNVVVMIPFCRSVKEADRVLEVMAENGLKRGEGGLEVYVMCEIPSNVILAKAFAERFDGFSIGSNDLTQLTLGVDRDSAALAELFDEQDDAVKWMIRNVIESASKAGAKVGLCGQAPSDHPKFAAFLVDCGIDSISVTPDSFISVKRKIAEAEAAR